MREIRSLLQLSCLLCSSCFREGTLLLNVAADIVTRLKNGDGSIRAMKTSENEAPTKMRDVLNASCEQFLNLRETIVDKDSWSSVKSESGIEVRAQKTKETSALRVCASFWFRLAVRFGLLCSDATRTETFTYLVL